jgi:hypothetical protein
MLKLKVNKSHEKGEHDEQESKNRSSRPFV